MYNTKTFITFGIVLVSVFGSVIPVYADDSNFSITDNDQGSNNSINITSESTSNFQQNNTANIENNVEVNTNTGDNTATDNSGDTNISTGDIKTETNITNSGINQNIAHIPSGGLTGGTAQISGNSSKSNNSITADASNNTTFNQDNYAFISNNVIVNANTGNNSANWNKGDVSIRSGHITAETNIENKRINNSFINLNGVNCDGSCKSSNEMILKIFGNGYGSFNKLLFKVDESKTFNSTNLANIFNDIKHNLNTGGNVANDNEGDIKIHTGDIKSVATVVNKDININHLKADCDCPEKPKPEKPEKHEKPTTPPTQVSNGNGHIGGNGAPNGDILGAAIGEVLPVTGSLFLLWATIASLIMFFAGWYLRFRSGCAPGLAR